MGVAVGIDLGTTNSCVAIVQGDQAKIVESVYGDRIHPSVICFHPSGEVLAGPRAKERLAIDPENTIYSFKRLLGQKIDAPEITKLISQLPYNVMERNGIPVLQTRNKEATLPEVSALMLKYLREMCEETFGTRIDEAIITVPANFTDVQRASTKIAGRIAGFNVLRILNEPTAAALAYGFGGDKEERIAVYDFGGGTFDITIIELLDDIFEVLSTAGDNFLGGDDFDEKIVYDMLKQFEKKHGFPIEDNPIAMQRIRSVAERAKCQLSSINEVNATLRELVTDKHGRKIDFSFTITRERFEQLASSLIERSLATCEEALELAKLKPENLDNVVLVGGSTRIPMVRQKVEEFFGCKPKTQINPDEVVAIGAAINAFSLTQEALDPAIKQKKRANLKVDPFSSKPESPEQSKAPQKSADPFSSEKSPLADMSDPFADIKHPISSNPRETLGKIDLSQKRTMIGMGGATETSGKPSKKIATAPPASATSPAAAARGENIDLPGLPANAPKDEDMLIPPPARHMDSELDSWGEPEPTTSKIPGQRRPSMADDPDLPVPLNRPSRAPRNDVDGTADVDLSIPTGPLANEIDLPTTPGEIDLPTTPGETDLPAMTGATDLPTTAGETDLPAMTGTTDLPTTSGETDLPTTSGATDLPTTSGATDLPTTSGATDLPTTSGATDLPTTSGATDLPTTSGETDLPTTSGETDLPANAGERNLPIPLAPPIEPDTGQDKDFGNVMIEAETTTGRRDDTSSFAPGGHVGRPERTDEIEALDDVDIEEIGDVGAPSIPPREQVKQDAFDAGPSPEPRIGVGAKRPQTPPQSAFAPSEPPPAFARKSQSLPPVFDADIDDEPEMGKKISYHPYHPLDEVVGDDGREAQHETHEAFTVPVKNATPAVLLDVSPRGLGIATAGGYCDIIIERNAAIPIEQSRHFSTSRDNQSEVFIEVYQGESRRTEDNTQLGRIELRDLRPAPRGEISILVTFEVDTDGILNVRAVNEETNASQSTQIKLSGGLADDQVEALVEKYAENAK